MGGLCSNRTQDFSDAEILALKERLNGYKTEKQEYESQIHRIQAQINALSAAPPGSEKHTIRALITKELEDLRSLLQNLTPDIELPLLALREQDHDSLQMAVREWLRLTSVSLQRVFQMKLRLQQLLAASAGELHSKQRKIGKAEAVAGDDLLQKLLAEYEVLVEETYIIAATSGASGGPRLTERIAREEAVAQSLSSQSSELNVTLERLRTDLNKKKQLYEDARRTESDLTANIRHSEAELLRLKNELVLCKETIKEIGYRNEKLEKEISAASASPLSEQELKLRVRVLQAEVNELEDQRQTLQTRVFTMRETISADEEKISDLEERLLRRGSIEDVSEKMTSVQEKLRDLMVSLESVSSEDDMSPRNYHFD